jgi:hypothetical protein
LRTIFKEIKVNLRRFLISMSISLALPCLVWAATPKTFVAQLTGAQEVPALKTKATGNATFVVSPDGKTISYEVKVNNIIDITMAHIHLAAAGKNGPVAVWLYPVTGPPPALKPGTYSGILADGKITAKSLVGPLKGNPLSALIKDMETGKSFVNVHTMQHPAGEIRGQIGP